jgi:hypothetical protein
LFYLYKLYSTVFILKVGVNFEECEGASITFNEIYANCIAKCLKPQPTRDLVGKLVTPIFCVTPQLVSIKGEKVTVYKNISC